MRQYEMFECALQGPVLTSRWAAVDLRATFVHEDGHTVTVPGFYAGEGVYRVRFLPHIAGRWTYTVSGVVCGSGSVLCAPARTGGPVGTRGTGFCRADGSWFHPFGTTVYALLHQSGKIIDQTMETLRHAPFNKVRLCVFPKHYQYNANEPDFYPFEQCEDGSWDVSRPSFAFWDHLERRLRQLGDLGIEADLILFHPYDRWGFSRLRQEDALLYLDYLLRRLAAFPNVWWSLANEYDVCLGYRSMENWEEIEDFVASHDPYHHPLSNHNIACFWDASRPHVTHASLQTKRLAEVPRFLARYGKPVIIDECCYEGNICEPWGSISGREMTHRFWRAVCGGGYCTHGETFYDDQDVLWWAKGGVLKGESPARIAFLRSVVEGLPGPLEPVLTGLERLTATSDQQLRAALKGAGQDSAGLFLALLRMPAEDRLLFRLAERLYTARCGDEAYLTFYDLRTPVRSMLELPEEGRYTVEVLDVWEMTRQTVLTGASGTVEIPLPGKEGMAVLATKE